MAKSATADGTGKGPSGRTLAGFGALLVGTAALWDTPVLFPLKVLVVFFHELSHGAVAVLTGGSIEKIEVVAQLGGRASRAAAAGFSRSRPATSAAWRGAGSSSWRPRGRASIAASPPGWARSWS